MIPINILINRKPECNPAAAEGRNRVYRKKEKSTNSQARGKMKQINTMKKETVMQCLPSSQSKY